MPKKKTKPLTNKTNKTIPILNNPISKLFPHLLEDETYEKFIHKQKNS